MKVDLHLHSHFSVPNGDSIKLDNIEEAIRILHQHHVKVVAFTDHNNFSAKQYLKVVKFAKSANILVLPGIELDVVRPNGIRGNVLVIFENLAEAKILELEAIIKLKTGKWKIRIEQIEEIFSAFKMILIPHVGKSDFCTFEDLAKINYDAIEVSNFKHPNYLRFAKKALKDQINYSLVAFSDTHRWNHYPEINYLYTDIDLEEVSFEGLKAKFKLHKNFIRRIDD